MTLTSLDFCCKPSPIWHFVKYLFARKGVFVAYASASIIATTQTTSFASDNFRQAINNKIEEECKNSDGILLDPILVVNLGFINGRVDVYNSDSAFPQIQNYGSDVSRRCGNLSKDNKELGIDKNESCMQRLSRLCKDSDHMSEGELKSESIKQLRNALSRELPFYIQMLDVDDEKKASSLESEIAKLYPTNKFKSFTGSLLEGYELFNSREWKELAAKVSNINQDGKFAEILDKIRQNQKASKTLKGVEYCGKHDQSQTSFFKVLPPFVTAVYGHDGAPSKASKLRPTANEDRWEKGRSALDDELLSQFNCKPWDGARIINHVSDYLTLRGIPISNSRSRNDRGNLQEYGGLDVEETKWNSPDFGGRVKLIPDPLLNSVNFKLPTGIRQNDLLRLIYTIMPTADFDVIYKDLPRYLCGQGKGVYTLDLRPESQNMRMSKVYLTSTDFAVMSNNLAALGYSLNVVNSNEVNVPKCVDDNANCANNKTKIIKSMSLLIEEIKGQVGNYGSIDDVTKKLPTCSSAISEQEVKENKSVSNNMPPIADDGMNKGFGDTKEKATKKSKKLEIGVEYAPGLPLKYIGRGSFVSPNDDATYVMELSSQNYLSGSGSYERDYILFPLLGRRLGGSVKFYENNIPDKNLGNLNSGIKESGVLLGLEMDLTISPTESKVASVEMRRQDTSSLAAAPIALKSASMFKLGGKHSLQVIGQTRSYWSSIEPSMLIGKEDGGQLFKQFGLEAGYHGFVSKYSRVNVRAHYKYSSANTPVEYRSSFGGDEYLRGFKNEVGLARRIASAQFEYWAPLPFIDYDSDGGWKGPLRQKMAASLFFDIGRADIQGFGRGVISGFGLGLRFAPGKDMILRFDWAKAINTGGLPHSKSGEFYFSGNKLF